MSVRFEQVGKQFGEFAALTDFSLDVTDGEFMVLLGPSGCGKTTALRILAGLEEPSEGRVFIAGQDVTSVPPKRRDIAMVFQNYALYPHMSVYDNIAFALRLRHIARHDVDRAVREAADLLGLGELLRRKPGQLSGGQRQRVALGRAIVRRPRAFLMDEPLSNLDAKLRAQTRLELIRLHRRLQTTTLYVTHDQVEAMTMGQRIAVMERGRLQQVGTPAEIYARPANLFVAGFIGIPTMTFFAGPVRQSDGGLAIASDSVEFRFDGALADRVRAAGVAEATVGVRPEHFMPEEELGAHAAAASFAATVDVIESLGNEQHVTLLVDGRSVVARLSADARLTQGETHRFAVAPERLVVFDSATGERIG